MRKFTKTIACGVLCTLMMTGCGQTEAPAQPAETTITETTAAAVVMIEIKGGAEILSVPEDVRALELTCREQMESLQSLAAELTQLEEIHLTGFVPKAGEILQLEEVFENVQISCDQVEILGKVYPADLDEIDLTALNREDIPALGQELKALKNLQAVRLSPEGETGSVSLEDAAALHELCPELTYHYAVELFGQVLSTDMKEVSYFKTSIGDADLEEFRKLLPLMHDLDRLVLDWCVRLAKGEPIWGMETTRGTTLYLCLEDTLQRVQRRLCCITEDGSTQTFFSTVAGTLADDLEEQILDFLREHPDTVLIVVDTFQMIRGNNGEQSYGNDYQDIQKLKRIADTLQVTILLVHILLSQW